MKRNKGKIWANIGLKLSELCKNQRNIFVKTKTCSELSLMSDNCGLKRQFQVNNSRT